MVLVQEASSRGCELGKAQLILPSQNNSFRMHCRLEGEQRLNQLSDKHFCHQFDLIHVIKCKPEFPVLLSAGLHERRHREGEGLVPGPVRGRNGQLEIV